MREVKENNERAHTSIYECFDEYEFARNKYQNDSSNVLGEPAKDGQVDSVSEEKRKGDGVADIEGSDQDRRVGIDDTQYSLRDSEGCALTSEQAAFFKDSKVGDKDGHFHFFIAGEVAACKMQAFLRRFCRVF